ncbi:HAD family acid phosphatase [Jatrophihabitans telluris]|uniref:HAD family acid phosphatase n=1 Tax=Jatrophihabitans telluris TaxID=2038343 RepID=A0ABY4R0C5_9ACTN|nr:HAD family acid phosphatase [Jatrophihabitans telluris]UQX89225.1 HAD family acid phosphatase [Jatrophihabitans telluris]
MSAEMTSGAPAGRTRLSGRWPLLTGALIAALGLTFGGITTASAHGNSGHIAHPAHPAPPSSTVAPTRGDSIPNVTLVENKIKAYYGDTVVGTDHVPSTTGNYAKEVHGIEAKARSYLAHARVKPAEGKKSVVFDIDDTTLNTYNYEIFSGFSYNPMTNADYVNNARFPEVYGMPALVNWASSKGYTVFFLTGRPETQRAGTVTNLSKVGYQVPLDTAHLYLKYTAGNQPSYIRCAAATCTTTEYKSQTRKHIESLGYDLVANFGDQFSDLRGGYGDKTFKIPNPMYYLP